MKITPLTNRTGVKIGSLRESGNRLILEDRSGSKLGYYDRSTNTTYDRSGNKVGNGDLLSSLLKRTSSD